jgi:cobalt-zinc-cadmium efflux system membrane fusion protein
MTLKTWRFALPLALSPLALLALGGCNKEAPKAEGPKAKPTQVAVRGGHDHGGWWCDEHGVPEEVCGQCNAKVAAEFKKKGDWCNEHDRPDSQCFVCHPELKEKFAAQYRAKYDKEPPPVEDEKESKKEGRK